MAGGRFSNLEFERPELQPAGSPELDGLEIPATAGFVEERSLDGLFQKALAAELAGDFESGLRHYSAALGEDPLALTAWLGQLRMLLEIGEYPEVELWAGKALEHFPENPQLWSAKALALFRMGRTGEAQDLSDAALAKKGETEIVWLARGEVMIGGRREASEECFNHAVRVADDDHVASLRCGMVVYRYGHYAQAIARLEAALAGMPACAWGWYLLGQSRRHLGLESPARMAFAEARRLAPNDPRIYQAAQEETGALTSLCRRIFRR